MATEQRQYRESAVSTLPRPADHPLDPATFEFSRAADRRALYEATKRALDLIAAAIGLLLLSPLILLIAIAIKLDSRGPVFFKQVRLGKDLKPFVMIKFRSMRIDSDLIPEDLLKQNESTGPLFKMRRDPRVTRVGHWLRRTSLDELPQLLNILTGQMTLVGPRPPLPRELDGFERVQRQRLAVKPGLTGLWQVSGRSDLPFEEMVRLDLAYIQQRSLLFDLRMIVQTIPSVLLGRGAY